MSDDDPHNSQLFKLLALARDAHALWQVQSAIDDREFSTTVAERSVLEFLVREGAQSVPAIARARRVSRQHIQKLADGLVSRRLVEFRPNPAHKTSPLVDVTMDGERTYTKAAASEAEILNSIAPEMAETDLGPALKSLRALVKALKAAR